jgi:hypothetical protein
MQNRIKCGDVSFKFEQRHHTSPAIPLAVILPHCSALDQTQTFSSLTNIGCFMLLNGKYFPEFLIFFRCLWTFVVRLQSFNLRGKYGCKVLMSGGNMVAKLYLCNHTSPGFY